MARRITIRDIAEKTGFHYSTVSLALRGDPSLPAATQEKIRRAAEKMGYAPDPMVQALSAYRQTCKPPAEHAPLAWLTCASRTEFRPDYMFAPYLDGVRKRARQFGYRLEEFLLGAKGMTPERMQKILVSRGITGVIVAPQPGGTRSGEIRMDWSPFAAVTLGYSLAWPPLHLVTSHHNNAVRLAVRRLADLGYRRIGLYVNKTANARTHGGWLGGYAGEVLSDSRLKWIEPVLYDEAQAGMEPFFEWRRAKRLDAVICWSTRIDAVRTSGVLRVPEDLGMVALQVQADDALHTGINQNDEEIGKTAVDVLLGMLRANERGLPGICRSILIESSWQEGTTVRRKT